MSALAKEAGLEVNRGIVVDDGMRTSDPDIFALGECAEVGGQVYGLVAPLYEMARVAAAQLAGDDDGGASSIRTRRPSSRSPASTSISLGDFADGDDREEIVLRDAVGRRLQAPRAARTTASSAPCSTARPPTAPGSTT